MYDYKIIQYLTHGDSKCKFLVFWPNMNPWDYPLVSLEDLKYRNKIGKIIATFNVKMKDKNYGSK